MSYILNNSGKFVLNSPWAIILSIDFILHFSWSNWNLNPKYINCFTDRELDPRSGTYRMFFTVISDFVPPTSQFSSFYAKWINFSSVSKHYQVFGDSINWVKKFRLFVIWLRAPESMNHSCVKAEKLTLKQTYVSFSFANLQANFYWDVLCSPVMPNDSWFKSLQFFCGATVLVFLWTYSLWDQILIMLLVDIPTNFLE